MLDCEPSKPTTHPFRPVLTGLRESNFFNQGYRLGLGGGQPSNLFAFKLPKPEQTKTMRSEPLSTMRCSRERFFSLLLPPKIQKKKTTPNPPPHNQTHPPPNHPTPPNTPKNNKPPTQTPPIFLAKLYHVILLKNLVLRVRRISSPPLL